MAVPEQNKRRAMDAISCPETQAHLRAFHGTAGPTPAVAKSSVPVTGVAKQQAMSAIKSVETLAHIGAVKLTGGISLYAARIREADRQAGTAPSRQLKRRRDAVGREV